MYSEFDRVSCMSMSNSELSVSINDSHLPTSEVSGPQANKEDKEKNKQREKGEVVSEEVVVSCNYDNEDDGYHTPTSPRHRIPLLVECPPAPRRPSSASMLRGKRKAERGMTEAEEEMMVFIRSEMNDAQSRIKKARSDATIH